MATTSALPQGLRTYLATCSAEHADQIIQTLRNAGRPAPSAASSMTAQTGPRAVRTGKKQRNKKAKQGATGGPKRPLNSWMAFRKYYNASLAPHTQKAISKVLTTWWRDDPFEAKWAILAKAYSTLRGSREKEDAPLDEFFRLCAPRIGVIPPDQYQRTMGWQLIPANAGDPDKMPQVVRMFIPNVERFDEKYTTTNLSANDLVEYCMDAGYIQANTNASPRNATQGALTMAVQPTITAPVASMTTTPALTISTHTTNEMSELSPWSTHFVNTIGAAIAEPAPEPISQKALTEATTAVTAAGSYPYNNLFDPTNEFELTFNPNETNNGAQYDAFDPSANATADEMLNLDWSSFINDDSLV